MAIPDFQSVMLPLLKFCADGQEHTNREAIDALSQEFGLTKDEQKQLLPSGQQRVFDNRLAWARAHMKMAGLVENTRRGVAVWKDGRKLMASTRSRQDKCKSRVHDVFGFRCKSKELTRFR